MPPAMLTAALALALSLPSPGVFVPHESLAGVHLRDTPTAVRARVGKGYTVCKGCDRPTWFYFSKSLESGLGVTFRNNRVAAVYTLGSPPGWRTSQGLRIGQETERIATLYGATRMSGCIGYQARSVRRTTSVTTIYSIESYVSGFALTLPSEPVCR
jgi:hypothetical protein